MSRLWLTEADIWADASYSDRSGTQHRQLDTEADAGSSLWRLQCHRDCLLPAVSTDVCVVSNYCEQVLPEPVVQNTCVCHQHTIVMRM